MKSPFASAGLVSVLLSALMIAAPHKSVAQTSVSVTVPGTAGPWSYVNGGLNTSYQYGNGSNTAPATITSANGFLFSTGVSFTIQYVSGFVKVGSSYPATDANGDTSAPVNNGKGSTGTYFPSKFSSSAAYPANLGELMGTFTDGAGAIVGTPFAIGDLDTVSAPAGAARLELGINDDAFADNTGSFTLRIIGTSASAPEPAPIALLGVGLSASMVSLIRRRIAQKSDQN